MKFTIKQNLFAIALLLSALAFAGCSNTTKPATSSESNKPAASSEKTSGSPATTASGDKIGIAECDDYIEKYEACITGKVPEASRSMMKSSFDRTRKSWKDLAANPQTKGSLASACSQAKETAKQSMTAFKCDW